jgi:hypothetical protein
MRCSIVLKSNLLTRLGIVHSHQRSSVKVIEPPQYIIDFRNNLDIKTDIPQLKNLTSYLLNGYIDYYIIKYTL